MGCVGKKLPEKSVEGLCKLAACRHSFCRVCRKGVSALDTKAFALTMGLGMAAGATVAMMLPRGSKARRTVQKAADAVEDAMEEAARKASCCLKR